MNKTSGITIILERLGRVLQNDAHTQGLKPTQWEALRYLARANRFSSSPSAVTAYLGVTKGTVSQTLNALERKGLIKKVSDQADRRNLKVSLTSAGSALLHDDPAHILSHSIAKLRRSDREGLEDHLEKLLLTTIQQRGGRPFGACKTCRHFRKNASGGSPHLCGLLNEPLTALDSKKICVEQEAA